MSQLQHFVRAARTIQRWEDHELVGIVVCRKNFCDRAVSRFLLEGLYLLRKLSRKSQQLIYLLLILVEWLSNGWIGLLTSLVCGMYFFGHWKDHAGTTASIKSTVYGDGQEGTENLMQK